MYGYDPKTPGDEERAARENRQRNTRITKELEARGLYPQGNINAYLATHDVPLLKGSAPPSRRKDRLILEREARAAGYSLIAGVDRWGSQHGRMAARHPSRGLRPDRTPRREEEEPLVALTVFERDHVWRGCGWPRTGAVVAPSGRSHPRRSTASAFTRVTCRFCARPSQHWQRNPTSCWSITTRFLTSQCRRRPSQRETTSARASRRPRSFRRLSREFEERPSGTSPGRSAS